MVLNTSRPRGAGEQPDRVLRSPARWSLITLGMVIALAGVAVAIGAAVAPPDRGEHRSVTAAVLGVQLALLGGTTAAVLTVGRRRRPLPAARAAASGVALPLRTGSRVASLLGSLVIASLGVTIIALADSAGAVALGAGVIVIGLGILALVARGTATIHLDPDGLTLPAGVTPRRHIPWGDVVEVAAVGGWQPTIVVTWRGPGLSACRVLPQAWPPSVLVEVVDHYRTHASDRASLTDPQALDRFRT